jgi:DnaJ-domain-containing protein 1
LLEDVLDGLFHIAKADGAVHEAEFAYVRPSQQASAFPMLSSTASRLAMCGRPTIHI